MSDNKKEKIIVILGPTASGKTSLSIRIAKEIGGEIISADSRQVYKGLDIGTEKITEDEMEGIPHHLIDVADPTDTFTVKDFVTQAVHKIQEIRDRGNIPLVVGGTGFYIDSLLYDTDLPEVLPNEKLREELESKTSEELFALLEEKDSERAETIDPKNKRRLVRALEIVEVLGKVPKIKEKNAVYDAYTIGITTPDDVLRDRIESRLDASLLKGLVEETKNLLNQGLSEVRLCEIGLEYRIALSHLNGELDEDEMKERMQLELWQYAKRQKTWFKRNDDINWFSLNQKDEIEKNVKEFLN